MHNSVQPKRLFQERSDPTVDRGTGAKIKGGEPDSGGSQTPFGAATGHAPLCPLCGKGGTIEFVRREAVPVHQNLACASREQACSVQRGTLAMHVCGGCEFVFNATFDPDLLDYGQRYDNSQTHSACFAQYVDGLVAHVVEDCGIRDREVVEVGCGKGIFLAKLVDYPGGNNRGVGFDPTYEGPDVAKGGRLRFQRTFYSKENSVRADAVVCRHVIEHVRWPGNLLADVRAALGAQANAKVFFETPCVEWILSRRVVWDLFYEHCSLFTARSLASAFIRAGFGVSKVEKVFGHQYLWLEGQTQAIEPSALPAGQLVEMALAFGRHERGLVESWRRQLRLWRQRGRVALWGAGAKGVTFCNLVDPDASELAAVVDVNPSKQGKYVPGTGHPVVSPAQAARDGVAVALVLNPNYVPEIQRSLEKLRSGAAVVDLMSEKELIHEACA
jgi:2-polyprenyl-3-methyl-5-hydroxy-6-metoxy-1,4-benzoquinol methylase